MVRQAHHERLNSTALDCCDPPGTCVLFPHYPGVSLRSTLRLLADNPPGCNRSAFLARQDLGITVSAGAWEPLKKAWGQQTIANPTPNINLQPCQDFLQCCGLGPRPPVKPKRQQPNPQQRQRRRFWDNQADIGLDIPKSWDCVGSYDKSLRRE